MDRVNKLDGENIIVVTNNVALTPAIVDENRAGVRQLIATMTGPVVLIIDYRQVEMSFADTIKILQGNQQGKRDDLNKRTFTIFVGTSQFIQLYRNALEQPQFGEVQIPVFDEMDGALETARLHIQKERSKSPGTD